MKHRTRWWIPSVSLLAALAVGWSLWQRADETEPPAPISLMSILGGAGEAEGFKSADRIRAFGFPEDHGAHPGFRNEWWYLTGNLATDDGRQFGYQFTIFRNALVPEVVPSASRWRGNQVYMAHFALSDVATKTHHAFERFGRGAVGIAGAENPPLRVWLDDWRIEAMDDSGFPLLIRAAAGDVTLDLELNPQKPVVLNGDRGLSHKGGGVGNASYYYSVPRLESHGTLRLSGDAFNVTGSSWLDREWSTSALAEGQSGWDWFALQFENGWDLMIYRLRRDDGSTDPASGGTLVDQNGVARVLGSDDIEFRVLEHWQSPHTGTRYPLRWQLGLPGLGIDLMVEPVFDNQEMDVSVRYWEGAVTVAGDSSGARLKGRGYMELAGYSD